MSDLEKLFGKFVSRYLNNLTESYKLPKPRSVRLLSCIISYLSLALDVDLS